MTVPGLADAPTKNQKLLGWVEEIAALTKPGSDRLGRRLAGGVGPAHR